MTVSTFFPNGDPETVSVDGQVARIAAESFSTLRDALAGTAVDDSSGTGLAARLTTNGTPQFDGLHRGFFLFDTASLGDSDTIDSATFEFVSIDKINDFAQLGAVAMVTSAPASNTALVTDDYNDLTDVQQATNINVADVVSDSATYNAFTLNTTGRGNIKKLAGEITKFGMKTEFDRSNTAPTLDANRACQVRVAYAEETLEGDKRPKLVVTHTAPPSAFVPKILVF